MIMRKKRRKEEREEDAVEYPNGNVKEGGKEILQTLHDDARQGNEGTDARREERDTLS